MRFAPFTCAFAVAALGALPAVSASDPQRPPSAAEAAASSASASASASALASAAPAGAATASGAKDARLSAVAVSNGTQLIAAAHQTAAANLTTGNAVTVATTAATAAAAGGLAGHGVEPLTHRLEFSKFIKGIAVLSNILLQLSPIRMMRDIRQAGSTLEYDPLPIFTMFFGSVQWFGYGAVGLFLTGDAAMQDVMQAYILGLVLGAFYLYTFARHCHDAGTRSAISGMVRGACFVLAFEVLSVLLLTHKTALRILGSMCAFFSIVVTASPLVAIEDVFRTQSVASMQTDIVIVCFFGSCAWTGVGFMMHDVCIALPNCFGIAIGGIQVHLILKFAETSGLWMHGGLKPDSTSALLRSLREERGDSTCPEKTGQLGAGYEASVYKRVKIIVLLAVAHGRFLLEGYVFFASSTLTEACKWLVELEPKACFRSKGCHSAFAWSSCRRGPADAKPGTELGERAVLL